MPKQKVLFICAHNSARSQMAAALMKQTCGEFFEVESAGLEPGVINPTVIEVLQELGIRAGRRWISKTGQRSAKQSSSGQERRA